MKAIAATLIIAPLFGGCAEMTHLTRTRSLSATSTTGTAFFIDAKQRGVFVRGNVLCAEPSPDALSALAASNKLDLATPKGLTAGDAFSIAESAGSIGLRTQSIQLMRDHMYRLCEALQSGAITPLMFELLHRRFQTTMVAILAIEQLTGVTKAPTIVLGGSASAGNAEAVTKLTATREDTAKGVADAQNDLNTKTTAEATAQADVKSAQAAFDAASDADKPAAQTKLDATTKALQEATAAKLAADSVLAGRKAALAVVDRELALAASTGSASSSGTVGAESKVAPVTAVAIANAVQAIVEGTMKLGNRSDFCFTLLGDASQKGSLINPDSKVLETCLQLLQDGDIKGQPVLPM